MYAQLDIKSSYSFLDGVMSVDEILQQAHTFNYAALAINDVHNMHHVMELLEKSKKLNIKPIISMRTTISHPDPIVYLIYAKNNKGYQNMMAYSSKLNIESFENTFEQLVEHTKDCVVIVYGEGGIIETANIDTSAYLKLYKQSINDFYIGISNNSSNKWYVDNQNLKLLCAQFDIKTVALPKVEFKTVEDREVKKLFVALSNNRLFNDHANYINDKNYFFDYPTLEKYYDQTDLAATIEIAKKCNVNFETMEEATLPIFESNHNVSSDEYLVSLCATGLKRRLNNQVSSVYSDRLKFELSVITNMKYSDYFLIVYDVILFARKNNIYVGPGRGSSAGSLVAYVLGITHIDPVANNLLFERFLNPERISLPDIDIDFPDDRRADIIEYVTEKYGADHVAQIVTFGTFAARQSLRDVGKALQIPSYKIDRLSKMISTSKLTTLSEMYEKNSLFKKEINNDPKLLELYSLAQKIEGKPRHTSIHAAGIIMSREPLVNHVPLLHVAQSAVSQYSMNYLEQLGLNKIDFLGLRNLSIISEVVSAIGTIEILKIPLDDKKTYELLQAGDTSGLFQLESYGMTELIKELKPTIFSELVAVIALYRPGPSNNIPAFLKNRQHPEQIEYYHPKLEPILKETYGVIVYQEQIMQVAQVMAGFTLAKADILRKAMSSKQADLLHSLRADFILGSQKIGYTKQLAEKIYDLIEKFANYGFNKAHSYAYGLIAYQMAYLKANYNLEFTLSLLNGVIGSSHKLSEYISAARKRNIRVIGPNINYSQDRFLKGNNSILFPLTGIKGIGKAVVNKILLERQSGLFKDFFDFIARSNLIGISRAQVEALINAGALDLFAHNRTSMLEMCDSAYMYANLVKVEVEPAYLDFDIVSKPKFKSVKHYPLHELELEKEVLGMYLSEHPIVTYKQELKYKGDHINSVKQTKRTRQLLGIVNKIKTHRTKFGDLMAFVELIDEQDEIDLVLMPNVYKLVQSELHENQYIEISGKIDKRDSILVEKIEIRK